MKFFQPRAGMSVFLLVALFGVICFSGCEQLKPILDGISPSSSQDSSAPSGTSESPSATSQPSSPPVAQVSTQPPETEESLSRNPTYISYKFDGDAVGSIPAGFAVSTVGSPDGQWEVAADASAPSPSQVMMQKDGSSSARYTALMLSDAQYKKLQLRARVKIAGSGNTQSAGLLIHARDAGNGYSMLIDSKKKEIRLERVVAGKPLTLKTQGLLGVLARFKIEPDKWYSIQLDAKATSDRCELDGYFEGMKVFEERDNVFLAIEKCGLVTVNDTVARFDNFSINETREIAPVATPTPTPRPTATPKPSPCVAEFKYRFDSDTVGTQPVGFVNLAGGNGEKGSWPVVKSDGAPSKPNVLYQDSAVEGGGRFSLLMLDKPVFSDFEVQCDLRTLSGKSGERMAGIVFRYQDPKNYYFAGIDTTADEVVLVRVANGERQRMEGTNKNVANQKWYELKVRCVGMEIRVELDDTRVAGAMDNTFMTGKIGVFTRSNTLAHFDDLLICALAPPTQ